MHTSTKRFQILNRGRALALVVIAGCLSSVNALAADEEKKAVDYSGQSSRFWLEPLRQNYILPYSYLQNPNQAEYSPGEGEPLENEEIKLQVSIQIPLTYGDMLTKGDELYFGVTLKSFWQAYNENLSAPFRETNYQPEVYYDAPLPIKIGKGIWFGRFGFAHESNGRTQLLSRSWNRVFASMGYRSDRLFVMLQPWHRLPEGAKDDDGDPLTPLPADGDDNPDIEDFMGHFELTGAYILRSVEFTGMFRRNFSEGHGAFELGASVALWGRLRGYVQYFQGYGESLIDYNYYNRRIGVGLLFSDLL